MDSTLLSLMRSLKVFSMRVCVCVWLFSKSKSRYRHQRQTERQWDRSPGGMTHDRWMERQTLTSSGQQPVSLRRHVSPGRWRQKADRDETEMLPLIGVHTQLCAPQLLSGRVISNILSSDGLKRWDTTERSQTSASAAARVLVWHQYNKYN